MTRIIALLIPVLFMLGLGAAAPSAHAYYVEEGYYQRSPVLLPVTTGPVEQVVASAEPEISTELPAIYYEINKGDTLYQIARSFSVSVQDLIAFNSISNPNQLQIGQKLQIPAPPEAMPDVEGKQPVIHKVLSSTLTAYTAGRESTGKTPSHPQYGITYSGSKAAEGRTIAVDPAVIPLGSTVFIEGIGIRKAEDIGSAIRGSKIDVFMENVDEALDFGVKKDVKVYVLNVA